MTRTDSALGRSFRVLSSGDRLVDASSDPASLSTFAQLSSSSRQYTQAVRNISDGLSLTNIADSALSDLSDIGIRLKELSEQSANGVYSSAQRSALNSEAQSLVKEWNRVVSSTSFNDLKPLDGTLGSVGVQAGVNTKGAVQLDFSTALSFTGSSAVYTGVGDGTIASNVSQSSGNNVNVQSADIDGDGDMDIISAQGDGYLSFLRNDGTGAFTVATSIFVNASGLAWVSLGDFNGDGDIDVATVSASGVLYTLANNGSGSFSITQSNSTGTMGMQVATGDIDGDGDLDLLVDNRNNYISVFKNNGSGGFTFTQTFNPGSEPNSIYLADFDGDGDLDVASVHYNVAGNYLAISKNNGSGSFTPTSFAPAIFQGASLTAGDYDGDGDIDLFASNYTGTDFFLKNNGSGAFSYGTSFSAGYLVNLGTKDYNGDGYLDIYGINDATGNVALIYGSSGGFSSAPGTQTITIASDGQSIVSADVNGDGITDFVTGSYTSNKVNVIKANGTSSLLIGGGSIDLTTQSAARTSLATVDTNLNIVSVRQGVVGAQQSRLAIALGQASSMRDGTAEAASRIRDADVATEATNLVRLQILQNAQTALLSQANSNSQTVEALLFNFN